MEERDVQNLVKTIKQQTSHLFQEVENSKAIKKQQPVNKVNQMVSDENNGSVQFSMKGTFNNNYYNGNNSNNNNNNNNNNDKIRQKSKSNLSSNNTINEIQTPSLTPQGSGLLNNNNNNQQQEQLQQMWSQQLYQNLNGRTPNNQSSHHSKSPSVMNTTNRQLISSIHQTPNASQMITPNGKRFGDQTGGNNQFKKQLINSNSKDNLAKRIEFNNQNDTSMTSSQTPLSYSPINGSRRFPLMNDQVNIHQNSLISPGHHSSSLSQSHINSHAQQQQQLQQFQMKAMNNQMVKQNQQQLQNNQQKQYQQQQQMQQFQRGKMMNQNNNQMMNMNQGIPNGLKQKQNQNQQQQFLFQQMPQQMRQMMPNSQQQQMQMLSSRQDQFLMKQLSDQYHYDSNGGMMHKHQHNLSDGILGENDLENDGDYQQEQDTFEDQAYNQDDDIEDQENMIYNDMLMSSQQNQFSNSYLNRNDSQTGYQKKKLSQQYLLQQQQQQQSMSNEILKTPSQLQQYNSKNPQFQTSSRYDYQSLHSFHTPKMSPSIPYARENSFPFNQFNSSHQYGINMNAQTNMNQFFFDSNNNNLQQEEDNMQKQMNPRQQHHSISARDSSMVRITPTNNNNNNQDSEGITLPLRNNVISHTKNSSNNFQQPSVSQSKKERKSFQNQQYQILQSPIQDDIDEEFLQNMTNIPSPIIPNNNDHVQNYFPSRDQSFLMGNNNINGQQQNMNASFIRNKSARDYSQNTNKNNQNLQQFQQTFSSQSQAAVQLQPQYFSVGGSQQDNNQYGNSNKNNNNNHRLSKHSKQNLDSSMISARKTPTKNQINRKSPNRQLIESQQHTLQQQQQQFMAQQQQQQSQVDEEKYIQLQKKLKESELIIQKMQDEFRQTKEELEDYKYALSKTTTKCKQLQKQLDQKGVATQLAFYKKQIFREKNNNRNLQESNRNIKRKILKLIRIVQDQYIKDSEEQLAFQNEANQIELQNNFLREILQIASLNDPICDQINKIIEKEEEDIYKNQEPPNQDKLIERQRNKRLIERIDCEEENFSEENDDNYIQRLIQDQKEIEDLKRQQDNTNINSIYGLILSQANKSSDMRDLIEDQNMESPQNNNNNPPQLFLSSANNGLDSQNPTSPLSSEDKSELSTGNSLNTSNSEINESKLNNKLSSLDLDDSCKNRSPIINSFSLINPTSLVSQTSNKSSLGNLNISNNPQQQQQQQQNNGSLINSQSILNTPSSQSAQINKPTIGTSSLISPISFTSSLISSTSLVGSNNNNNSNQPPALPVLAKLSSSLKKQSIFSDISKGIGGGLGSSTISPQNRLKSPEPTKIIANTQKTSENNQSSSSSIIKKNLEQINNSNQNKVEQQEESNQNNSQIQKQDEVNEQNNNNNNSSNEITKQNNAFSFENCDDDDNYNILDDNDEDNGPIDENDIMATNPNQYFLENNNNNIDNNDEDDSNQISENQSQQNNLNNYQSNNNSINQSQSSNDYNNNNNNNPKFFAPSTNNNNISDNINNNNNNNSINFNINNNNNNQIMNNNNNNNVINFTINNNNKQQNPQPLIAASPFISSSSFFSPNDNSLFQFNSNNNIQNQQKKKDDEIINLNNIQQSDLNQHYYNSYEEEQEDINQNKKQEQKVVEEINFSIPFK